MTSAAERELILSQAVVRRAFLERLSGPNNDNGAIIIAAVMTRCGATEQDADEIIPELVAFMNWFLEMLGIRSELTGLLHRPQDYGRFVAEARALQAIANMDDNQRKLAEIGVPDAGSNGTKAG
jgi:hypothetical protein